MAESKDNVKVAIRVRPLSEKEKRETGQKICVNLQEELGNVIIDARPESKTFTFDYVADMTVPQEQIFEMVGKPISSSCMSGYNGTIFAYGQTGAGKTFTIQGPDNDGGIDEYEGSEGFEQRGLMPRCIEHIFSCISTEQRGVYEKEFLVKASFLEIYQEQVIDLLSGVAEGYNLQLREDIKRGVYVDGLIEENVSSAQDTYEILRTGTSNRHVGSTSMNKESSRSHSVFILTIESKEIRDGVMNFKTSRFHMIDLAGSERQKATDAAGERLREAGMINKSLSALGNVINSLVDIAEGKSRHVHYRDSKLTFLLKDSLGGNSRTFIVANISASVLAFGETLSTLKFAQRAKMIKNKAVINEDTAGSVQLLKEEIRRLKEELTTTKEINQLAIEQCPKCAGAIAGPQNTLPSDVSSDRFLQLELLLERNTKLRIRDMKTLEEQLEHKEALVQSLQSQIAKFDKRISNDKMVLKFRDSTIARLQGQQPGNPEDSEVDNCRKENFMLREQVETNSSAAKLFMENEQLKEELVRLKREVMEDPGSLIVRLKENLEFTEQMGDWLNEDITIREKMKATYDEYLKFKSGELVPDQLKLRKEEEITELKLIYADRISELTEQLQASEAAKKDMEISLHKKMEQQAKRIEELVGENALLMRKCDETLVTQSRIEDEHSQSEGTVKRLRNEVDNLTSSEAKLRLDLENMAIERTFLEEERDNLTKTTQEQNETISRLETDVKTSSGLITDLRSQTEALTIENAGFKHAKTDDEKALTSLRAEIGDLQTTLETRLGELTALGQDLELAQEDNQFIRTQVEELKSRAQDLEDEKQELEQCNEELMQTVREQEEAHGSLEDTVTSQQGEISGLQSQIKDLRSELGLRTSELTQKTQDLEEEKRAFLKTSEEADRVKTDAEERIKGLIQESEGQKREKERFKGELEEEKLTFLGKFQEMELLVTDLRNKLKDNEGNLKELELKLASQSESSANTIESLQSKLSQETEKSRFFSESDETKTVELAKKEEERIRLISEIDTLKSSLEIAVFQATEQRDTTAHLEHEIETSKTDFFDLSQKMRESEDSRALQNDQIQRISEELKSVRRDFEALQILLENTKTESAGLHQELAIEKEAFRRRIEELESVLSSERKAVLQEFGQLSLIETERNSLESLSQTQQEELAGLKSTLQSQEVEIATLRTDFDHIKAGEKAATMAIVEALEAEEALREENMRLKQAETELQTTLSEKETESNRLSDALEIAMKDVSGLRTQMQEAHVREKGLLHSLADLSSQLKAIETDSQTQIAGHIAARSEEQTLWSGKCEELAQTLKTKERIYEEKIAGLAEHIHVSQQNLEHYQQLLMSAERQNSDLTCDLSKTQEKQASILISHQSRIQELQTELETAHVDIKALKEENKAKLEILQNTNRNILSTRQEIEMWKKCIEEKNESIQHLRHSLRKSEEDRTQLTTQLAASRNAQVPACTHESEIQYLNGVLKRREQELFELKEKGQLYYAQADEAIESQRKEIEVLTKRCAGYQTELGKCREDGKATGGSADDRRRHRSHESSGDASEAVLSEKPKGYRESEAKENDRSPLSHKHKTQPPKSKDDAGILKIQLTRLTEELISKNEQIEALQQIRSRPKTRTEDEEGLRARFETQIESLSAGLNKITEYVFSLPIVSFNPEETGIIESTIKAISSIYEAYEAKCRELQAHTKPARPHADPAAKYHTEPHQTFGSNYVNPSNFKNPVAHYHALINSSSIKPGEFLSPGHDRRSPGKPKKP